MHPAKETQPQATPQPHAEAPSLAPTPTLYEGSEARARREGKLDAPNLIQLILCVDAAVGHRQRRPGPCVVDSAPVTVTVSVSKNCRPPQPHTRGPSGPGIPRKLPDRSTNRCIEGAADRAMVALPAQNSVRMTQQLQMCSPALSRLVGLQRDVDSPPARNEAFKWVTSPHLFARRGRPRERAADYRNPPRETRDRKSVV